MADYVLSAKGTYDGSDFDSGIANSASKLQGLKDTASSVGSQVAGFFANSFGSVAKSIGTAIGTVTAGVTTLAATGGMTRALNIEQAQTMFKGMKLEWSDYYDTIMKSVDGTAFGFDVAAKSCAQLAASGVAAGDDMTKALNGCVGTAATFGQDLGDLSAIWAKVAASGKLTGEQVAQFTDRGINSLSILATYLGKTTEEVSKMVTAGEIDFQTFSDAMYSAFGDSAKAANETFTGSLANMKAALSKIGQDWMTPLKDSAIPVFNSIRVVLNSCRTALKPLSQAFGDFLGVTYDTEGNLTRTSGAIDKVCGFLDSLAEKIQSVDLTQLGTAGKVAAAGLAVLAAVSLGGLISQIPIIGSIAGALTGNIIPALQGVQSSFLALSAPIAVAVAALAAFTAVFAYCYATNEEFRNSINGLVGSIASSLAPAFQSLTQLAEPLQSLFSAVCNLVMNLSTAFLGVVAAVAPLVATIISSLVPIISTIIETITQVVTVITETVTPIIQQITDLIATNMPAIQSVIETVLGFIQAIVETVLPIVAERISTEMAVIKDVIDTVWPYISEIVTSAMNIIQDIITVVMGVINGDWGTVWNAIQDIVSNVWNIIENLIGGVIAVIQSVISNGLNAIQSVWSGIWNTVGSILSGAWEGIKNGVSNGVSSVVNFVSSIPSKILGALGNLGSLLWDAGSSIVSGLLNGIKNSISGVYDFVSGIAGTIASLKGPKRKDLRLLIPNGGWIMQSLETGMDKQFESVKATVAGYGDEIGMSFGSEVTYKTNAQAALMDTGATDLSTVNGALPSMIALLKEIAAKDTDVYMDINKVSAAITSRTRSTMKARA